MVGDYELDLGTSVLEVLDEYLDEDSTVHWWWSY
jgi:hypothetical protein